MKLALNHEYRFDNVFIAWLAGFLQAFSIFVIECVNFLVIMQSDNFLNVVMNFMALAVIADFDTFFYGALGQDPLKDILTNPVFEDLYTV